MITLFILSSVGATLIITTSFLFKPIRKFFHIKASDKWKEDLYLHSPSLIWIWLDKFISCPQCIGFWVGAIISFYFNPIYILMLEEYSISSKWVSFSISIFLCGCISSIMSYLFCLVIKYLSCKIKEYESK